MCGGMRLPDVLLVALRRASLVSSSMALELVSDESVTPVVAIRLRDGGDERSEEWITGGGDD